jgi:oligogalacturonide lyase
MNNNQHILCRRTFLQGGVLALGAAVLPRASFAQHGPDWQYEYPSYVDENTGVTVYNLTRGETDDQVMYQTHPMWTRDMDYFLFYSRRSGEGMRPHLLEIQTGEVRPIIRGGYQRGTMTWKDNLLFYISDHEVFSTDVIAEFNEKAQPKLLGRIPDAYQRYSGDITVDADGSALYFGVQLDEAGEKCAVAAVDLASGETRTVVETDFKVGHFQANPFRAGEIMFCWETGGDAPQRTWFVKADGSDLKPMYKEVYEEWVTHEVWWNADNIIFTIWPYNDTMKEKPHGIATASLGTGPEGKMKLLSQYPAWHTHGSPDGKWALGDDFDRNIWLVKVDTCERKLLTQGHLGGDYKTHPHGSFTPDSTGAVFTSSKNGVENVFYVPIPEWETLV